MRRNDHEDLTHAYAHAHGGKEVGGAYLSLDLRAVMDYQNRYRETLNKRAEFGSSEAAENSENVRL